MSTTQGVPTAIGANQTQLGIAFEASGDPTPLPMMLAALAEENVHATFFLDGRWAAANADLVRQLVREGHELATHGYAHTDWTTLSSEEVVEDLHRAEAVVAELSSRNDLHPWALPPYGAFDARVQRILEGEGYHIICRDAVDGGHWPGETTAQSIRDRALEHADAGDLVLFHTDRGFTAESLPQILQDWRKAGFTPGPLGTLQEQPPSQLLRHPDFAMLDIAPGAIRPSAPGQRWQSINLLEVGGLQKRQTNVARWVGSVGDTDLSLIAGDGNEPMPWREMLHDSYVYLLAGEATINYQLLDGGEHIGHVLANTGDFVLCPRGVAVQIAPREGRFRRYMALLWEVQR